MAVTVERVSVAGSWWRQIPHGSDPLWLASPPSSGRWQRGETVAAIYLAGDEDTAWAEWYRALAEIAMPPTHGMPRDLWRWAIAVGERPQTSSPGLIYRHPGRAAERGYLSKKLASSCTGTAAAGFSTQAPHDQTTRRSAFPRGRADPRRRARTATRDPPRPAGPSDWHAHLSLAPAIGAHLVISAS